MALCLQKRLLYIGKLYIPERRKVMLFRERKRWIIGLPWTFTVYSCDGKVLLVDTGFLNKKEEEIRLYRILDIDFSASLIQRIFGIGTIHLHTSDKTARDIDLINVKNAKEIKRILSDAIEEARKESRVSAREFMADGHDDNDEDEDINL